MTARPAQGSATLASGDFAWVCELVRRRSAVALEPDTEHLVASRLSELALTESDQVPVPD